MAEKNEGNRKSSSSFPFFKIISFISVLYLVILALEISIPYIDIINRKFALITISVIFFLNIITGGKGDIKGFKKKLAKELVK